MEKKRRARSQHAACGLRFSILLQRVACCWLKPACRKSQRCGHSDCVSLAYTTEKEPEDVFKRGAVALENVQHFIPIGSACVFRCRFLFERSCCHGGGERHNISSPLETCPSHHPRPSPTQGVLARARVVQLRRPALHQRPPTPTQQLLKNEFNEE